MYKDGYIMDNNEKSNDIINENNNSGSEIIEPVTPELTNTPELANKPDDSIKAPDEPTIEIIGLRFRNSGKV
jgi:hypothetical protein